MSPCRNLTGLQLRAAASRFWKHSRFKEGQGRQPLYCAPAKAPWGGIMSMTLTKHVPKREGGFIGKSILRLPRS